jgi:hypothetical protein
MPRKIPVEPKPRATGSARTPTPLGETSGSGGVLPDGEILGVRSSTWLGPAIAEYLYCQTPIRSVDEATQERQQTAGFGWYHLSRSDGLSAPIPSFWTYGHVGALPHGTQARTAEPC